MAHELDTQGEWQRLHERYHAMSDGELLELAAGIDDLTDVAADVLRREMKDRRLELEAPVADASSGTGREYVPGYQVGTALPNGRVRLLTLHDAMMTGDACDMLEAEGIEVEVRDVSQKSSSGGSFYGGPPVALDVIVPTGDRERSVKILREKMGLFPLQEVEEADPVVDDGAVSTLGSFGRREDAEEVGRVLDEARVWHRIVANEDGSAEDEDAFTVEVKEIDLVRAGELVERSMNLPEG